MNYYERHIGDYLKDTAHLSLLEHGVYARLLDVYYTRETALPDDQVARLIAARSKEERAAMQAVLSEFFDLQADGWHQARCDREIHRYTEGEPEREVKKANEDNRLKRHRLERAELFKTLTDAGHHAAWNIGMQDLRDMVKRLTDPLPATAATRTPATPPATAPATPATATQSPDPDTIPSTTKNKGRGSSTDLPRARDDDAGPGPDPGGPTPAGRACLAIKAAGIADVNPGHPRLHALLQAGVTPQAFGDHAAALVARGKGKFALLLATVEGQLRDAAAAGAVPPVTPAKPAGDDWDTQRGVEAIAERFGLPPWDQMVAFHTYRAQVRRAEKAAETAAKTAEATA